MSLRTIAEQDLGGILEDGLYGFGWSINITDPAGLNDDLTGFSGDISQMFDPDTGIPISGALSHVALRISSLKTAGFEIPRGVVDESQNPWVVKFDDIDGESRVFKIKNSDPDFTLGIVVCVLENYEELEE